MSTVKKPLVTLQQYIEREHTAQTKSEFYRGEVFAMSGASIRHNDISGNIFALLKASLRGKNCRPSNSDQRIRIPANGLATYPDVSVVCGPREVADDDDQAITNPTVIFEVLSKSTEANDRGKKFALYRDLDSLEQYVLVSQNEQRIECFSRRDDGDWLLNVIEGESSSIDLKSIEVTMPLSEVYSDVHPDLEPGDEQS
jgi:Uma2 family endonuclease